MMVQVRQMLAPASLPNVPGQPLNAGPLWITVHETANPAPTAGAEMHARYVNSGGGPGLVSFHFTVDKLGAWQMLRCDEVGWHASDGCDNRQTDTGCFASVAIETCVNDPLGSAGWTQTLSNLHALIVGIIQGHPQIQYGTASPSRFSVDRIRPHKAWAVDRKHCPQRLLDAGMITVDGRGKLIEMVRQSVSAGTTPAPNPRPQPVAAGDQRVGERLFVGHARAVKVLKAEIPRQWADPQSAPVGPAIAAGLSVSTTHVCVGSDNRLWYVLTTGARFPVDATIA